MNKNLTDITLLLDRSGSMASVRLETISGINHFMGEQKQAPGEACVSLIQFDDRYEPFMERVNVQNFRELSLETYQPRGWTALYGAIGKAMEETGKRLAALAEKNRPAKVLFVIITDGHENYSQNVDWAKPWDLARVKQEVEQQRSKYNWEFVFIGANQDAVLTSQSLGSPIANAMNYTANAVGTQSLYASLSVNTRSFRSGAKRDMSWEDSQKQQQEDAKASG